MSSARIDAIHQALTGLLRKADLKGLLAFDQGMAAVVILTPFVMMDVMNPKNRRWMLWSLALAVVPMRILLMPVAPVAPMVSPA